MRLVGASNFYIQLPFLLEAALAAGLGAVLAIGSLILMKTVLIDQVLAPSFQFTAFVGLGRRAGDRADHAAHRRRAGLHRGVLHAAQVPSRVMSSPDIEFRPRPLSRRTWLRLGVTAVLVAVMYVMVGYAYDAQGSLQFTTDGGADPTPGLSVTIEPLEVNARHQPGHDPAHASR